MPLNSAQEGETYLIKKVNGKDDVRAHLENLGFVAGAQVSIVSKNGGNIIVQVKDSRIAISSEMAVKIII